ncbi:hypothetical protein KAR91_24480 [Candidatus Pacearchaeota archaeon]|nr:hypothetical protein [Candidatus Pacearchaeota archaeon]
MDCKCGKCGHEWTTKRRKNCEDKKPKCCPGCKSYTWEKRRTVDKTAEDKLEMKCTKCRKEFKQQEHVFSLREGRNIAGAFVPTNDTELQGLFCVDCAPEEDKFPFIGDKK